MEYNYLPVGEIRAWIGDYIPPIGVYVITYPCPNDIADLANLCQ